MLFPSNFSALVLLSQGEGGGKDRAVTHHRQQHEEFIESHEFCPKRLTFAQPSWRPHAGLSDEKEVPLFVRCLAYDS